MASFSVDITSVLFAGYYTAYKDITITGMPQAGVVCSITGTNSDYFNYYLYSGNNVYRVYTTMRNSGTTSGTDKTGVFRIENAGDSTDYVEVSLTEEYCNTNNPKVYAQKSQFDNIYSVEAGKGISAWIKDGDLIFDYKDVMGEWVELWVDGPVAGSTVTGNWLGIVTDYPYTDTGFKRVRITCINNYETYARVGNYKIGNTTYDVYQNAYPSDSSGCSSFSITFEPGGGRIYVNVKGMGGSSSAMTPNNLTINGFTSPSISIYYLEDYNYYIKVGANSLLTPLQGAVNFVQDGVYKGSIIVNQEGLALAANPSSLSYTASGGSQELTITYVGTLNSNAANMPSWLSQSYVTVDQNHRTYTVTADSNSSVARSFDWVFTDDSGDEIIVTIEQDKYSSLSITPSSDSVMSSSGTVSITVNTIGVSSVSYNISDNWISFENKSGNVYTFSYTENVSSRSRTGTIVFTGEGLSETYTLTQNAYANLTVEPLSDSARSSSGSITISVIGEGIDTITYSISDSWITFDHKSLNLYTFNYAANSGLSRSGTIVFSGGGLSETYTLYQEGTEVVRTMEVLPPKMVWFGGRYMTDYVNPRIKIIYGTGKSHSDITITTGVSWLTNPHFVFDILGDGYFDLDLYQNNTGVDRYCTISVSDGDTVIEVPFKQSWKFSDNPYEIWPDNVNFSGDGGTEIVATEGHPSDYCVSPSWVSCEWLGSNISDTALKLTAERNTGTSGRSGVVEIYVSDDPDAVLLGTITVTQGEPSLSAAPSSLSFVYTGETKTSTLSYIPQAGLSVVSKPDWMTVNIYDDIVNLTAVRNTAYLDRTGTVVICETGNPSNSVSITVNQDAVPVVFRIDPSEFIIDKSGGSLSFSVINIPESGIGYSISSDGLGTEDWLTVSIDGEGGSITVAENTGPAREARIVFYDLDDENNSYTVIVTQEGEVVPDIELLIDGKKIDFGAEDINILFTKLRTDYTNPTIVRNSFTKTIRIPGTKDNNKLFNDIWKLNRSQWQEAYNPSKRAPFILNRSGFMIEKGYVKLDNIVWDGNFFSYEITLYGQLGNILYGLSYRNGDGDETIPMTLADLTYDDFVYDNRVDEFQISRELIINCWNRLSAGTGSSFGDLINFMVSYDGIPQANNFDPKKIWTSIGPHSVDNFLVTSNGKRLSAEYWNDELKIYIPESSPAGTFPGYLKISDDEIYRAANIRISRDDPDGAYGLMELKNPITTVEARDFRSYLLRPVIKVSKIFDAIGDYISTHFGYELDLSDPFFSSDEFLDSWMTLSMLYEIDPDIESWKTVTKQMLLGNTSSPASYLISYCKVYGIYLDIDIVNNKFTLTRLPRWFDADNKKNIAIDHNREIKITPLSFDKSAYTFDYTEGEGEFSKKYKENYGINYGSKKVNTGYRFDASVSPYINNNIYKSAVDALEQSIYYRYPTSVRTVNGTNYLLTYPIGCMDEANPPTYTLFNYNTSLGVIGSKSSEMRPYWYFILGGGMNAYNMSTLGYQFQSLDWVGLKKDVYQDAFPKVQLHSEDNKGIDGKNVLVKFNGFKRAQYGSSTAAGFNREQLSSGGYNYHSYTYVNYLISDDIGMLKEYTGGKNCYYDDPDPAEGQINYMTMISSLPSFTRCNYDLEHNSTITPGLFMRNFGDMVIGTSSNSYVSVTPSDYYFETAVVSSSERQYPYINISTRSNHSYFIAAAVETSDATDILNGNSYAHPDIVGSSEVVYSKDIRITSSKQIIGSIVRMGDTGTTPRCVPLSTYNNSRTVRWTTHYLIAYDLTELGMEDRFSSVDEAINYFGLSENTGGYCFYLEKTLDFGLGREVFVPGCIYSTSPGIYDRYWSKYISDVYSVTTRVFDCYCYLPNIDDVFRWFYIYDGCYWILSKVVDWSSADNICKATFIKVNDINSYTS